MNIYGEKAMELFREGFNCCQSVCLAFVDDLGYDQKSITMIAGPFGGGMGRLREVCGAVSGMNIVLGYTKGYFNPEDDEKKKELYETVQMLAGKFKTENGTIICRELLGEETGSETAPTPTKRTDEYYATRPCEKFVGDAATIISEFLIEQGVLSI